MKNKKDSYFGIYINDKIPKIEDKENRYYKNIELDFKGKAFIIEKNQDNTEKIKEELKSGKNYKRKGNHIIKFTNENNEVYYINIKIRKLLILWLFLFAFLIILGTILFFNNNKNNSNANQIIQGIVSYDVELEGFKYVFDINYENENFTSVELTDKVSGNEFIYPGSSGCFYIVVSTQKGNKDMYYKMKVKEEINKPQNLKFIVNGKTYNSAKELSENVNGEILKNSEKILKIDWIWDYDTNDDVTDTFNGENIENYRFLMTMIGTEGG